MHLQIEELVGGNMEDKIFEMLICMLHISEKMKCLSMELDKMYNILGDPKFIEYIKNGNVKE
jgi:hypothetical protein